jgi:hypothetical protein
VLYRLAADLLVLLHLLFIVFVIAGGFAVLKWQWMALVHLPAAVWGAMIEFRGWICPLTPMENRLRQLAGEQGYAEGFIEHYILPVVYPSGLTRDIQTTLGTIVIVVNVLVYGLVLYRLLRN